jgi:hypothetical protein
MTMAVNSSKSLVFMAIAMAIAVTALSWGFDVTAANADTSAQGQPNAIFAIRDPKVDPNLSPKQRAQVQRDAFIKQRKETRKFIKDMAEGKKPAASEKSDKGVAK